MQVQLKALVQYKKSPAIVVNIADKIEIKLSAKTSKRVRSKDIELLHPGPVDNLNFETLSPKPATILEVAELLTNESVDLTEFSELIFANAKPESVWASWQLLQQDLYFSGEINSITANDIESTQQKIQQQQQQQQKKQANQEFLQRLQHKTLQPEDFTKITDIEQLALMQRSGSHLLQKIGVKQTPQSAHNFLCAVGYWHKFFNPYPPRKNLQDIDSSLAVPDLACEPRTDLTNLKTFAIDDIGNTDPDDAISLDGDKIWVHIADVATLVSPDSELDIAAKEQSTNLYLPEKILHMLPIKVTKILGLGLSETSAALSFGFKIIDQQIDEIEVCKSNIKAKRISYQDAETDPELSKFFKTATALNQLRPDAVNLHFPEVKTKVNAGQKVTIRQLPALKSRDMVMEFMIGAGVAAAKFASSQQIPFIFTCQTLGKLPANKTPAKFSEMLALRKQMVKSLPATNPEPHNGLGIELYSQVTSPLRRYFDLVNHQQLTRFLKNEPLLTKAELDQRINESYKSWLKKTERDSNLHWKCVYLSQHPKWQGEAIIMAIETHKVNVLIPELGLDTKIKTNAKDQLDQTIKLEVTKVELADLSIYFKRIN